MIEKTIKDFIKTIVFTDPLGAAYVMPDIDPIWSPPAKQGKDKITFIPGLSKKGYCIGAAKTLYQFDVWCDTYEKMKRISDTLIQNLDERSLKHCYIYYESGDYLDKDTDNCKYRYSMKFRVIHKRGE